MNEKYYDEHPDPHSCMQFIFNWNQTVPYSYLSKKKPECLYRNFVYCLSQKFLAVHVFNFYAVNLQTPGNHGKCLENLFKFGGEKRVVTVHTLLKVEFFKIE